MFKGCQPQSTTPEFDPTSSPLNPSSTSPTNPTSSQPNPTSTSPTNPTSSQPNPTSTSPTNPASSPPNPTSNVRYVNLITPIQPHSQSQPHSNITRTSIYLLREFLKAHYCGNYKKFWRDVITLGHKFPRNFQLTRFEGLSAALKQYAKQQKFIRRKNYLFPVLMDSIFKESRSGKCTDENMDIQLEQSSGTARSMLVCIRKLLKIPFGRQNCTVLPPRRDLDLAKDLLHRTFIQVLEPMRTFTGFRVNLIKAVKFALKMVYNRDSLEDLRLDIYGDTCREVTDGTPLVLLPS